MLLINLALAAPPVCPLVLRAPADATAVREAVAQGADPNTRCSWTERVSGLQTFGGVMLAVTVPVIGAIIAHDQKVTRTRSATPMQLAIARGDEALFDALGATAELPVDAVTTVLSGDDQRLLPKVIARGADPHVKVLVGPSASSASRLRAALDAGVKLDRVSSVVVVHDSLSAEWVQLALSEGLPSQVLVRPVVWRGGRQAFLTALKAADDPYPFLLEALEVDRWDLFDLALAEGVSPKAPPGQETLLMAAASRGNAAVVKRMLALDAELTTRDARGRTALHHAASSDNPALVGLLKGAGLQVTDEWGNTPLAVALRGSNFRFADALVRAGAAFTPDVIEEGIGDEEVARYLLRKGASPDSLATRERAWIVATIERGDEEVLGLLLAAGAKLDGATPPTSAVYAALVRYRGESWLRRLVAAGASLDACPEPEKVWGRLRNIEPAYEAWLLDHGMPPAHRLLEAAVGDRDLARARSLLERGIEPRSVLLGTIVGSAKASENDAQLVALLLEHGADPNGVVSMGNTPVHRAYERGRFELLRLLVEGGGNLNRSGFMDRTPLTHAVNDGERTHVEMLLDLGADPNQPDDDGRVALLLAIQRRDGETARLLLARGARADCRASFRDEPCISVAMDKGLEGLVPALLDAGAPADATDWRGTPLVQLSEGPVLDAFLAAGAPVTEPLVNGLARKCDLKRLRSTKPRWPQWVRPSRSADRACKKEVRRLEKEP